MFSEYEHLVEMPESIADNIDFLTEMNDKIEEEVYERLCSHINDYNRHMKRFKDGEKELTILKGETSRSARLLEKKIAEARQEAFTEARKSFFGGFDIGTKGWVPYPFTDKEKCPRCLGERTITVKHKNEELVITCDTCSGYGTKNKYGFKPIGCEITGFKHEEYKGTSGETVFYVYLDNIMGLKHAKNFFLTKEDCEKHIKTMKT